MYVYKIRVTVTAKLIKTYKNYKEESTIKFKNYHSIFFRDVTYICAKEQENISSDTFFINF